MVLAIKWQAAASGTAQSRESPQRQFGISGGMLNIVSQHMWVEQEADHCIFTSTFDRESVMGLPRSVTLFTF